MHKFFYSCISGNYNFSQTSEQSVRSAGIQYAASNFIGDDQKNQIQIKLQFKTKTRLLLSGKQPYFYSSDSTS